jgi:hypothetical protein
MQQFLKTREQFPPEQLVPYAGKYVAWSPDGTHILASDTDPLRLKATVKGLGHDPADVLISSVPDPDLVILGGGVRRVLTHAELVKRMMNDPAVRAEYEAQAKEFAMLDELPRPAGRLAAGTGGPQDGHQDSGCDAPESERHP